MCSPPSSRHKTKQKHFFLEVHSEQEYFTKDVQMHINTPEQPLIEEQLELATTEILLRYQLFVQRRQIAEERERHQEELAQVAKQVTQQVTEQVIRQVTQQVTQQVTEQVTRQVEHRMLELFREIRQIEEQLRSSDTPVNIREQLRRRHEDLCALLNI